MKYYGIRGIGQETALLLALSSEEPGLVTKIMDTLYRREAPSRPVLRFTKVMDPQKRGDGTVPWQGAQIAGLDEEFEVVSDHGSIPSNADAQKILTDLRKKINNEDFRKELVAKMSGFTSVRIAELRKTPRFSGLGDSEISVFGLLGLLIKPDREKIKLRDELRRMALAELRNARVNVTIATGADRPEELYMVISDYEIKDAGTGVVSGATMKVKVDSLATFEQVVRERSGTGALMAAYWAGMVTLERTGPVGWFETKLLQWIGKYFMKL